MSFEEEFDKIIRQKTEEAKYSFDEANWHKVSSMLEADRKVAGGRGFMKLLLPLGGLVLIGMAGYFSYAIFTNTELVSDPVIQKTTAQVQPQVALALASSPITEKNIQTQQALVADPAAIAEPLHSPASSTVREPLSQTHKPAQKATTSAEVPQNAQLQTAASEPTSLESDHAFTQQSNHHASKAPENTHAATNAALNEPALQQEPSVALANTSLENVNTINTEPNPQPEGTEAPAVTAIERQSAEWMTPIRLFLPAEETQQTLREPFQYPLLKEDDYYTGRKLNRQHYLNIEAGAAYLFGWDSEKTKDGKGLDYYAGINYGRYLNRKLSVSFGLQVYNIANIHNPYYAVSNKEYGFGSTTMYTVVTTNNLVFASLPLRINYALNGFNTLGLGLNVGYLASANSCVETYYLRDNEKIGISEPVKSHEIYDGTQSFNMMLTAAYQIQLTNRVALKAEYLMGLTDLFRNSGTIGSRENSTGLRFGIQYTLFDK